MAVGASQTEMVSIQSFCSSGEYHRPLQHILKFADVPRPMVAHQGIQTLTADHRGWNTEPPSVLIDKPLGELEDVLHPSA